MCCSIAPADFRGTRILLAEAGHPVETKTKKLVHVLAYENVALNHSSGPNAMILHVQAKERIKPENLVDTTSGKHFFRDMINAVQPPQIMKGLMRDSIIGSANVGQPRVVITEHDIYTVLIAYDATAVDEALKQVPAHKRPRFNKTIFDWYAARFSQNDGWHLVICCFDNKEAARANPLMLWYEPADPNTYRVPGLDAHDGNPPDMRLHVDVDHWLFFGSPRMEGGVAVEYDEKMSPQLSELLPKKIIGIQEHGFRPNGDFGAHIPRLLSAKGRLLPALTRLAPPA